MVQLKSKIGKALKWDELANEYVKLYPGSKPKTLPMDHVFEEVEKHKDKYFVDPKEGTIHLIK